MTVGHSELVQEAVKLTADIARAKHLAVSVQITDGMP